MENIIIDGFAGGGGASVGIEMALGRPVDIAINHDPDAILMHQTNHPKTLHLTEDIFKVDLQKYVKGRHVALAWMSPDCFPAGNLVWTDKGYKPIEEVECNDYVLTHKGNYQKVYRTIKKNDYKFCKLKISGCEEIEVTPNHPFYARKKKIRCIHGEKRTTKTELLPAEWVKAEDLTPEYRVGIPINRNSTVPKWNGVVKCRHNRYGVTQSWTENTLSPYMDNPDFWWFIGRYFGDGYVSKEKAMIELCCGYQDVELLRPRIDSLGIKYTTREKKTTFAFLFSNKELCEFVLQFGKGAAGKQITPVILDLPKDLLSSFLDGYISADGHWEQIGENSRCCITTVSRNLAYGLQQCLLKAYGRYASLSTTENNNNVIEGRRVNARKAYILVFYKNETNRLQYLIEDGIAWVNVRSNELINGKQKSIYNLSVENDESFTVQNIAVHNCTSHSKAKGGKPREKGLRILPWAVFKHAKQILPDVIIMENVEEIQQWGPLDEKGYPIKERQGEDYQKFITAMKSLGYAFESRELVAANYGAPTTRKRWYAIFRRDGRPIVWPEPTHSKEGVGGLKPWEPIYKYLDFGNLGQSIFGRKKPLADKTMTRIAKGIEKFVLNNPEPFIVQVNHGGNNFRGQSIHDPLPTITSKHGYGIVSPILTPFIDKSYGGNYKGAGSGINEPLHTITTVDPQSSGDTDHNPIPF